MSSDYYDLLDVSRNDSYDTVRRSYRDLVKEYHPDVSDLPNAQERFQQIKAAYEVLNNPKKRKKYNQISHDEFVNQHGGYSSKEIKEATDVQLVNNGKNISQAKSTYSQTRSRRNQRDDNSSQDEYKSENRPWYDWILQGRTAENSGYAAYSLRLGVFLILTLAIFLPASSILIGGDYGFYFLLMVLGGRAIYLISFESLRKDYQKIDNSPESDAYSIPYAVGLGFLGVILLLPVTLFSPSLLGRLLGVFGGVIFANGLIGTVLAVGWGTADDYYNLRLDVKPVFWNFLVQAPIIVYLAAPNMPSWNIFALGLLVIPLLAGIVYTIRYHSEIVSELINRITV
ncbi:DnaJ domain-containing protein [Halorubrum ejinorense]|uniref:DnaJ domain-containing protein n=1 Tax=Halorubrum ejinorense TaxID=425309 RepID=A0AAV3SQ24_9EURY